MRDLMKDVVAECLAVAQALCVTILGAALSAVLGLAASMPNQFSSTAQDLARQKRTEIDYLNGYIVRSGRELGIAVPVNRSLTSTVKLMEAKVGGPSLASKASSPVETWRAQGRTAYETKP